MADVITPKLKVPFSISGTSAEVVEQDSVDELAQCVEAIVRTPTGFRESQPEYGMDDPTFTEGGLDPEDIQDICSVWEPRVSTLISSEMDELINTVEIEVQQKEQTDG